MPSSYTTSLRLTLPATGENTGTWGSLANTGITELVDASIAGTASIIMTSANYTLSNNSGAVDEARAMFIDLGGSPGGSYNVICPAVSKLYFVKNSTGSAQTLKTLSGTGVSIPNGAEMILRCDGVDVVEAANYFGSLSLGSALPVASGGTGAATLTGVLIGNGTSAFTAVTAPVGAIVGTTDTQTLSNKTIQAGVFTDGYTEEVNATNSGASYTISFSDGSIQILTLTDNCTLTFPTATAGMSFMLFLKQDVTGSRTVTWPASVLWPSATAPILTTTANKSDWFTFTADGTYWYGATSGLNY